MAKILVTGGAGFIGCNLIRHFLRSTEHRIANIDALTYAGSIDSLTDVSTHPNYSFFKRDICDIRAVREVFAKEKPDFVMHLAAESHVDRSISSPAVFIQTNVLGTYNMLQAALEYWQNLAGDAKKGFRFHHISTDEVFGSLKAEDPQSTEESPYSPNSPYAASKASSDHLVHAWHHTFGLPTLRTNCSNNYGPYQNPEKLIPRILHCGLEESPLGVYGDGLNVRDWLFVEDHVEALIAVLERGEPGCSYNIGGNCELTNLSVVERICDILDEIKAPKTIASRRQLIRFVKDRQGHDRRYGVNSQKIRRELGFAPKTVFKNGLRQTVSWYLEHEQWLDSVRTRGDL